ncbi:MAG: hypothetical protein KC493_15475 [Bacteriovoracaceae bacterium]|nr:hypothetical protein [Bacteriovoracaceae bacterium]
MESLTYKFTIVVLILVFQPVFATENHAQKLKDELSFLKNESANLDVYVPKKDPQKVLWFAPQNDKSSGSTIENEDSVSLSMSAIKKANKVDQKEVNELLNEVEEMPLEFKPLKKRRLRSR